MVSFCLRCLFWAKLSRALASLCLSGASLVDPSSRQEWKANLHLAAGQVVALPSADERRIDATGLYVLPAFWDLSASVWGNRASSGEVFEDERLSMPSCLRLQLFYGVGHIVLDYSDHRPENPREAIFDLDEAEMLNGEKFWLGPEPLPESQRASAKQRRFSRRSN